MRALWCKSTAPGGVRSTIASPSSAKEFVRLGFSRLHCGDASFLPLLTVRRPGRCARPDDLDSDRRIAHLDSPKVVLLSSRNELALVSNSIRRRRAGIAMRFRVGQLLYWTPCFALLAWLWSEPSIYFSNDARIVFSIITVALFAVGNALASASRK
jgi:hypothetical protein